jgi:hypothetical protein
MSEPEPVPGGLWRELSRASLGVGLGAARWWSRALVRCANVAHVENLELMHDVSGALAQRLQGTVIETEQAGMCFRGRLESVHLRRGGRDGAHFILTDVRWDGLDSKTVVGEAREMSIGVVPKPVLTLFDVQLQASIPMAELVAWADRRSPRWRLSVSELGLIEGVSADGSRRVQFEPEFRDGALFLTLRELGWQGLHLRMPNHRLASRRIELPPMPAGMKITEMITHVDNVEVLISAATLSWSPELGEALARRTAKLAAAIDHASEALAH